MPFNHRQAASEECDVLYHVPRFQALHPAKCLVGRCQQRNLRKTDNLVDFLSYCFVHSSCERQVELARDALVAATTSSAANVFQYK